MKLREREPSVLLMTQTITIKCPRTHATTKIGHEKPHRWAWQGVQLTKKQNTHTINNEKCLANIMLKSPHTILGSSSP